MNLIKRAGVYRELAILTAMLILTALLSFPARAEEAESQHEHQRMGIDRTLYHDAHGKGDAERF